MKKSVCNAAWLVIVLSIVTGCRSSIGTTTVSGDQFDYAEALRDSWKEQMLLNIVGLRYAEAPLFLEVTSVINQYSLEAGLSASAPGYDRQSVVNPPLTLSGRYTDRPTLTYVPLKGAEFTKSVLTPIPPHSVMSLIQAGWRADLLFPLTVRSVNGVGGSVNGVRDRADPRFFEMVRLLTTVQAAGDLSFRVEKRGDMDVALVMIEDDDDPDFAERRRRIDEILGLEPDLDEYSLVYGLHASGPDEIAMITRSILEMMVDLAKWIEVPEEHVASGRTPPTPSDATMKAYGFKPLIQVRSGDQRPDDAFVAVRYDDVWYWIENGDFSSKRTLAFIQIMFSLAQSGGGQQAPVVTVGAGG